MSDSRSPDSRVSQSIADMRRDYVRDGEDKRRGMAMIQSGDWGTTLEYRKDMNLLRRLMIHHMFSIYKRRYAQYFQQKADLK